MSTVTTVLGELATRAGAGAILQRTGDWNVAGVPPLAVVQPDSVDAIAAVLAFCTEAALPVEPAGAGTWLSHGRPPAQPPVVVSTARLNGMLEYEPADLVAGVRAGMTHADLTARLAEHGQVLTLDPSAAAGATVGATVALGAAGPLRALHRTPRDLLLGVEVVAGDGRVLRFGGRVVKNVAGYDLVRLLAGSRGTLGVITGFHVLLRSAAPVTQTLGLRVSDAAEAASLALAIRDRMEAEAIEIVDPSAGEASGAPGAAVAAGTAGAVGPGRSAAWHVLVRLAGGEEAVRESRSRLEELASVDDGAGVEALWRHSLASEAAAGTSLRLAARPAALASTLARAMTLAAEAGPGASTATGLPPGWRLAAHAADGIVRLWREPGQTANEGVAPERLADAVLRHADALAAAGGTLLCPVLPAPLAGSLQLPTVHDKRIAGLMAGLRQTFDPAGVMSPGRHGF